MEKLATSPVTTEAVAAAATIEAGLESEIEAEIYGALVTATRDYVTRNGFPGALVGMSGGIDSALVAAIAVDALGPDKVWGVSMPSRYTLDISNDDARLEAEALGIRYTRLPIEPAFGVFRDTLAETFAGRPADLTEENLQSRSRGVLLMALSNKFGHVVLTTGNKSEMAVGYATLYGDMCGGFAPIKDVYKTLVYRLARWRNTVGPVIPERVLTRAPSAELRENQTDQDSLPPYDVLDAILEAYVEHSRSIAEIVAAGFEEVTVRRVAGLVRRSEYKRRQAPPGPKVTACAFGRERRYPITALYGDV
jgi:NAD+ synthase (glutamine-hydrolysing)